MLALQVTKHVILIRMSDFDFLTNASILVQRKTLCLESKIMVSFELKPNVETTGICTLQRNVSMRVVCLNHWFQEFQEFQELATHFKSVARVVKK